MRKLQFYITALVVVLQLAIAWIIATITGWDFMNVLIGIIIWSSAGNAVRAELIRKGHF